MIKLDHKDIEHSDNIVLSARFVKVHLIEACIQEVPLELLILGLITNVSSITIQIRWCQTEIYKCYVASYAIHHYIIGLQIVLHQLWYVNYF